MTRHQPVLTRLESTLHFSFEFLRTCLSGVSLVPLQVADPGPCENDPAVNCGQSKTLCGHVTCECVSTLR